MLKKYVHDPNHILDWYLIHEELEEEIQFQSVCIWEKRIKMVRNKAIEQVKVQWTHYSPKEAT